MKMLFRFLGAFTMGLILAGDNTNEATPQHRNRAPKLMSVSLSEEFENMKKEFSSDWNNYVTVAQGDQWLVTDLTYSILNYGGNDEDDVIKGVEMALGKWSTAAPRLKFTQLKDGAKAHMNIEFISKLQDEVGKKLMGATDLPYHGGEVHFNGDEKWIFNRDYGFFGGFHGWEFANYFGNSRPGFVCIATHEFGHALGLRHSENKNAVMHPDYPCTGTADVDLHDDDIQAIQYLYPGGNSGNQNRGDVSSVKPPDSNPEGHRGNGDDTSPGSSGLSDSSANGNDDNSSFSSSDSSSSR